MSQPIRKNSLRYSGFDYASPAGVFITIVTHDRQQMFGTLDGAEMAYTPAGQHLDTRWNQIPDRFPGVLTDAFMVMPDHIHGILWMGSDEAPVPPTTGDVVRWLKTTMLADFTHGVRDLGWQPYAGRLWQRGYHDHIIRGERDLQEIRGYIGANPATWNGRM